MLSTTGQLYALFFFLTFCVYIQRCKSSLPWQHGPYHFSDGDVPLRFIESYSESCASSFSCNGPLDVSKDASIRYCNSVTGNVIVSGPVRFIPSCLTDIVNGDLIIEKNSYVTSVFGFGRLKTIGGNLRLQGNQHLTSLWGLESLEKVSGSVYITFNGDYISYSSIDALVFAQSDTGKLTYDISSRVYDMDEGVDQAAFTAPIDDEEFHFPRRARRSSVLEANDFRLDDELSSTYFSEDKLDAFRTFKGIPSLRQVDGDFYIIGNPALINLKGAESLETVGGSVYVERNRLLLSLEGFEGLVEVGGDYVFKRNDQLESLSHLVNLETIGGHLEIDDNNNMQQIGTLLKLNYIGGNFTIRRNWKLETICMTDSIALETVSGSLVLNDNKILENINGFENLMTVEGDMEIYRNSQLQSLIGFTKLTEIKGTMYVQGQFTNYQGLNNLETIGENLLIHSLPHLQSLLGLGKLQTIGQDIMIYVNPSLESISDMGSLHNVGGSIRIYDNHELNEIEGMLDALHHVQEYVHIEYSKGKVDCPRGTGTKFGQTSMLNDDTPNDMEYGNWCTLNCAYPFVLKGNLDRGRPKRMWSSQHLDVWSKAWGPYCF